MLYFLAIKSSDMHTLHSITIIIIILAITTAYLYPCPSPIHMRILVQL